jgi:UDP-GlcNAc:undecaprenyl-phosphate GlcNAc-1-phosphate transferase
MLTCMALLIVFIVGVLDDHRDAMPNTKFIAIAIAAVLMALDGIMITSFGTLYGINVTLGWFAIPFTVFAAVGYTNALNLIDGLDGFAGLISLIILGALFSVGYNNGDQFMMTLSGSFASALLAFMFYNWNPAKIFMGDSGSLTIGFVISILAIKATQYIHPVTVLFLVALPVFDTIIVMIRRKLNSTSMFSADKSHIHHVLLHFFENDVKKTVIFLATLQMAYSTTALLLVESSDQAGSLMLFIINTIILYLVLSEMLRRQLRMGDGY